MKRRQNIILPALVLIFANIVFASDALSNDLEDACSNCWPHPSNWKNVENHGVYTFRRYKDGDDATMGQICQECHGTNLTGGFSGVSCYSCHNAFPHGTDWKNPTRHGVYAFNNGWEQNCKGSCHGENYNGGYAEISCRQCHDPFPHPANWANTKKTSGDQFHGNYVLDNDAIAKNTCRNQCHGTAYDGGLSNKACASCHEAYPHMKNWSRPTTHGVYAITYGVEQSCGVGCHGQNYEGGNTNISCASCHENFPHPANYVSSHKSMDPENVYQCATLCHGKDLKGGDTGVDCISCHNNANWPLFKPMEKFLNSFDLY